jgi:hypothetical protein
MSTVQSAVGLYGFANHRFDFRCVGHIDLYERRVTVFRHHVNGLLPTVCVHVGDDQFCAFSGKCQGCRSTDAGSGSSNPI